MTEVLLEKLFSAGYYTVNVVIDEYPRLVVNNIIREEVFNLPVIWSVTEELGISDPVDMYHRGPCFIALSDHSKLVPGKYVNPNMAA